MSCMSPNHCKQGSKDNDERDKDGKNDIEIDSMLVWGFTDMHEQEELQAGLNDRRYA